MADGEVTVKELVDAMAAFVEERDWQQFHAPKNLAMGIVIEAGELMEHFQWISEAESGALADDAEQMGAIKEEVADVLCYVLAIAERMGIDLSDAFYEKMKRNELKYPAEKYRGRYKL